MTSAYTEFPHSSSGRMEATATGQTRVVPLQNVAYNMSQRINYVLTVKFPPKEDSGIRTCYALTWTNHSVFTLSCCSHRGQKGSIVAEGDTDAPSLADINRSSRDTNALQLWARQTDGSGMARAGRRGKRKVGGWMNNLNPFTDKRPRYWVNPRLPAVLTDFRRKQMYLH